MSITIEKNPEAKFEELTNPETNKTSEMLDAIKDLAKGEYIVIGGDATETPRGLSRRITVAIKKYHATREGAKADFDTKRVGSMEWAVMRRN